MQTEAQRLLNAVNSSTERWKRQGFQRRFSVTDLHGIESNGVMERGLPAQFYTAISFDFDRLNHWWLKVIIKPYLTKSPINPGGGINTDNSIVGFNGDGVYTGSALTYGGNTLSAENVAKIVKLANEYGLLPSGVISQMYLESTWGNSNVGRTDNNWSGIKFGGTDRPSGVKVTRGSASPEGDNYSHYASVDDYFKDHFYLLAVQTSGNNQKMYQVQGKKTIEEYTKGLFRVGGALFDYAGIGYDSYLSVMKDVRNGLNANGAMDKIDDQVINGKPKATTDSNNNTNTPYNPSATKNHGGQVFSGTITDFDGNAFNGDSNRANIDRIVIHHNAGTNDEIARRTWYVSTGVGTSAHYQVTPNRIWGCVGENRVAYHAGSYPMNQRSIGIEHLNSTGAPSWLIAEETYKNSAKLIADICKRRNIPCDSTHIIPHRSIVSTQCPGGIDLNKLISMANAILNGGSPSNTKEPTSEKPYDNVATAVQTQSALAQLEARRGQTVGSGECYAIPALYSSLLGGPGLGGGVTGITDLIGDGMSAKNIGTAYDWGKYGWAVKQPTSPADLKVGAILNHNSDNPYGHTLVIKAIEGDTVVTLEQNAEQGRILAEYRRNINYLLSVATTIVYPPELAQGLSTVNSNGSIGLGYQEPFPDDIEIHIDGIDFTPMFKAQFDGAWIDKYAVFPNDKPNEGYDVMLAAVALTEEQQKTLYTAGEHLIEISGSIQADVILRTYLKYNHLN